MREVWTRGEENVCGDSYRVLTGNVCVVPRVVGVERLHLQDHGW